MIDKVELKNLIKPPTKVINIIFTNETDPIADYKVKGFVEKICKEFSDYIQTEEKEQTSVWISNILTLQFFRAFYFSEYRHLQDYTRWWYEDEEVDMDSDMRSNQLWRHPVTNLCEDALMILLGPPPETKKETT